MSLELSEEEEETALGIPPNLHRRLEVENMGWKCWNNIHQEVKNKRQLHKTQVDSPQRRYKKAMDASKGGAFVKP